MDEFEQPGEFGDEGPPNQEQPEDHRPLIERIADKNWKTRLTAYDDLKKDLTAAAKEGQFAIFGQYGSLLGKMLADSNAGALDAALDSVIVWTDLAPIQDVNKYISSDESRVFHNVVDKAFQGKSSALAKGKSLLHKIMEVTDPKASTLYLLTRLGDKKPKVPPTCLEVIKEGLQLYGAHPFPIKEILTAIGVVLNGTNGPARESSMSLMLDLCSWIGKAPFAGLLENIRSAQKTEFERLVAEQDAAGNPNPVPILWIRKDRPAPGSEAEHAAAHSKKSDGREFAEEVDLPKKLKGGEYGVLVVSEKWSEQLKALQLVIDAMGPTPKIKAGCDVHEVVAAAKGFIRSPGSHLTVLVAGLRVIALLAEGMRGEFTQYCRPLTLPVITKCKEKKLVGEVHSALYVILKYCLPFDPFAEEVMDIIRNKKEAPHARVCMMEFVATALSDPLLLSKVSDGIMKPMADCLVSCVEDSDVKIRDASAISLGVLLLVAKSRGKPTAEAARIIMALEQSMPKVYKKVVAAADAPPPSKSQKNNAKPPPATEALSSSTSRFDDEAPPQKPPARKSSATVGATAKKSTASTGGAKKAAANNDKEDDTVDDLTMSAADAEEQLAGLEIPGWDSTIQADMASANWQQKADAVTLIGQTIADMGVGGQYSAALVVYLSNKTSSFKISNINILKAVINTACQAASHAGAAPFNKPAAWELIKHFGDKLSDKKTKDLVCSLLTALTGALKPIFVVKRMQFVMDKTKAPIAHQYYLEWLKDSITECGAGSFPIPALGTFCLAELENKVAAVRIAAVEVMGALYHQIGPRLASVTMSDDMKPAVRTLLEAEYSRVGHDPQAGKTAKGGEGDGLSLPRSDIFTLMDKNAMTDLNLIEGKTSWQNRKVAIEGIIGACERSGHYIDGSKQFSAGLSELLKSLKARTNDTQANLKPMAACAIGHLIASLEPEQGCKYLRSIAGGLISGLGDNKKGMRDATVSALQMAVTLNRPGGEKAPAEMSLLAVLIGPLAEALSNTVVGRQELLTFLAGYAEEFHAPVDCSELPGPLVLAMQDKTAGVRSLAEALLGVLNARGLISRLALDKATRDLAPAAKRTLMPSIEKMVSSWGARRSGGVSQEEEYHAEPSITLPPPAAAASSTTVRSPTRASSSAASSSASAASSTSERRPASLSANSTAPAQAQPVSASKLARQSSLTLSKSTDLDDNEGPSPWMLKKTSQSNQQKRQDDFPRLNWPGPSEEIGEAELNALKAAWEPLITPELSTLVFDKKKLALGQDGCLSAVTELLNQLQCPYARQHTDFLLRYAGFALCLRETAGGLLRVLTLITEIFLLIKSHAQPVHELELSCILPHLIDKSGHKSERHRAAFQTALSIASSIIPPGKLCSMLLNGLTCKNKRTRVVCIEEIQEVVEAAGAVALGRSGVKEIAVYLDSKDNDVNGRSACLELCNALYLSLGAELPKLMKLMGSSVSERTTSMIEDRIRQKNKQAGGVSAALAAFANHGSTVVPSSSMVPTSQAAPARPMQALTVRTAQPEEGSEFRSPNRQGSREMYENSPSPFRLEITPPAAITDLQRAKMFGGGSSPRAYIGSDSNNARESPSIPVMAADWNATPSRALALAPAVNSRRSSHGMRQPRNHLEGIYADIANKVDQYLMALSNDMNDFALTGLCDETKDYLKMLHSIAIGEWSQETLPEDDEALKQQIAPLCVRLTRCVAASFIPTVCLHASPTSLFGIDVSLVAVSLATLFAIVRRGDLATVMDKECLVDIFQECLRRIVDPRLGATSGDCSPRSMESSKETIQQIVRALNIVLLRLAAEAPSGLVLGSLIQVLYLCIPVQEVEHSGPIPALPSASMKPTSRLLLRVLGEEAKKPDPFGAPLDLKGLLMDLHTFFSNQPKIGTVDDTPLTAVKAVLSEMVRALGGEEIIKLLLSLQLSSSTLIFRLTCTISGIDLPSSPQGGESDELHNQLITIIDDITSARDKMIPIRQLHAIQRQHPGTDIHQYLLKISAAFRRFVMDTLVKLDELDKAQEAFEGSPACRASPYDSYKAGVTSSPGYPSPLQSTGSRDASEAMRIIEGLKTKPYSSAYMAGRDSAILESSPSRPMSLTTRSLMNDRIRGSLSSLTASLDLPPVPPSQAIQSPSRNGSISGLGAAVLSDRGDNDLAARLQRLKNMEKK